MTDALLTREHTPSLPSSCRKRNRCARARITVNGKEQVTSNRWGLYERAGHGGCSGRTLSTLLRARASIERNFRDNEQAPGISTVGIPTGSIWIVRRRCGTPRRPPTASEETAGVGRNYNGRGSTNARQTHSVNEGDSARCGERRRAMEVTSSCKFSVKELLWRWEERSVPCRVVVSWGSPVL